MGEITISEQERCRVEEVLDELDPRGHELTRDCFALLSDAEGALLRDYVRARLRGCLELGIALRAAAGAAEEAGLGYPGRGTESFVRAARAAWVDSFSPLGQCWRLAPVLAHLEQARDANVLDDIVTLEAMAENRMFGCLDDACRNLLG